MRKALAIICLTLVTSLSAFTLALASRPPAVEAATPTTAEARIIAAVNRVRVARGLAKVRFKSSLLVAARAHALELSERELLDHDSLNGWSMGERVRHYGYTTTDCTYWTAGEDLVKVEAGTSAATARAIVRLWMGSSAHRKVLLTARMRDIGVGIHVGDDGMKYVTVDLGRRIR